MTNILVVLADDIGLEQFSGFGRGTTYANTPLIDSWFANGVRFTKFYGEQLCSPTRAAMITGLHPFATGVGDLVRDDIGNPGVLPALPLETLTIAELIHLAGAPHATAAFGKWHLANSHNGGLDGPSKAGFDHYSGNLFNLQSINGESYTSWPRTTDGILPTTLESAYHTEAIVSACAAWIASQAGGPWCVWLAPYACHTPLSPPQNTPPVGTYNSIVWFNQNKPRHAFKACIESLDYYLGTLVSMIPPADWADTIVIIATDNGSAKENLATELDPLTSTLYEGTYPDSSITAIPPTPPGNYDYGRGKDSPFDTGVHLPLIFYSAGPLLTNPGRTVAAIASVVDIAPTILALLGLSAPPGHLFHGQSLKGHLDLSSSLPVRPCVYSEHFAQNGAKADAQRIENQWMCYDGQYTLVYNQPLGFTASRRFHDLNADPHQLTNLTPAGSTGALTTTQLNAHQTMLAFRKALVP